MDYRLYLKNQAGHIIRRVDLECEDDNHAIRFAADYSHLEKELWCRDRRIKSFPAKEEPRG